jgi:hypothetical protein
LKGLPREFRGAFLRQYQKALQVAFHPDRAPTPASAASRSRYLQVVAEAIGFLSENEVNYELATDNVPTRRNPLVELQRGIGARDEVIEAKLREIEALRGQVATAGAEIAEAKAVQDRAMKAMWMAHYSCTRTRLWMNHHIRFVVPVHQQRLVLRGQFVTLERLAEMLRRESTRFTAHHPQQLRFVRSLITRRGGPARLLGAMSKVHMKEMLRAATLWNEGEVWRDQVERLLAPDGPLKEQDWKNFMLPLVCEGMVLVTRTTAGALEFAVVHEMPEVYRQLHRLNTEYRDMEVNLETVRSDRAAAVARAKRSGKKAADLMKLLQRARDALRTALGRRDRTKNEEAVEKRLEQELKELLAVR